MTTNQTKTKSTTADSEFLGKAPVGKLMWQLAIPAITAQVINMLYNIVDRVYIGHIAEVGALALARIGLRRVRKHGRRAQSVNLDGQGR